MNAHKGFTLIETVIYLGLFTIIMGGFIVSAFYIFDSGNKTASLIAVQEEGTFLNRKLSWAIGSAIDADTIGADTLVLTRPDLPADENPLTISFNAAEGALMLERGSKGEEALNSAALEVSDVVFTVTNAPGRPEYVGVSFEVEDKPFRLDIYLRQ